MDSTFFPQQPNPDPFHFWAIGVIILSVVIVLLTFLRVIRYRRRAVRIRTHYPTPSRIESGFNRDCKNIFQRIHIYRCDDMMIQ